MSLDRSELAALTRVFSAAVLQDLARAGKSALLSRLLVQSGLAERLNGETSVGQAFDTAFSLLRVAGNRDEYVYRSAITEKILLGRHSLKTASVVHEFRAGSCKADMVVFNGTSTAYEIKSERDTLVRLPNQLDNYLKVFAAVNVVASPSYVRDVLAIAPSDVGVLALSPQFTLRVVREAVVAPDRISPIALLETLRTNEAIDVLRKLGLDWPSVPNTQVRGALRQIFSELDPAVVHNASVGVLKKSRSQSSIADFIADLPASLRAGVLAAKLSVSSRTRLTNAIQIPLASALAWN